MTVKKFNEVFSKDDSFIDAVKKQLYTQLPGIKEVLLKVRYINAGADISRSIEESWENIISAVSKESPACRTMIDGAKWHIDEKTLGL